MVYLHVGSIIIANTAIVANPLIEKDKMKITRDGRGGWHLWLMPDRFAQPKQCVPEGGVKSI